MTDPAHIAAHELDDEPIYFTANQQRIVRAGECARVEQQLLEWQYQLTNGRTPGPD
jgi:hypothetical protein